MLADSALVANPSANAGLVDLQKLFRYLELFNCLKHVSFDMSLARGLDYYTGVIYEAVVDKIDLPTSSKEDENIGVGSIAGGGRYDNLVGMFAKSKNAKIPCVGFSIGVERIYSILKHQYDVNNTQLPHISTDVYVIAMDGLLDERLRLCAELWDAGISADFMYRTKPNLTRQFDYCDKKEHQIPWAVIIGSQELADGTVRIKDMTNKDSTDAEQKKGRLVKRVDMVSELLKCIKPRMSY